VLNVLQSYMYFGALLLIWLLLRTPELAPTLKKSGGQ